MAARQIDVTHVGSLPRGDELTALLLAKDHGQPYDPARLASHFGYLSPLTAVQELQRQHRLGSRASTLGVSLLRLNLSLL